jgi:hypothetical protein
MILRDGSQSWYDAVVQTVEHWMKWPTPRKARRLLSASSLLKQTASIAASNFPPASPSQRLPVVPVALITRALRAVSALPRLKQTIRGLREEKP